EALDDRQRLLEGRRTVLEPRAHRRELRLVVAEAALDDEAAAGDRREGADLLGDEDRIPQRQEEQAAGGGVAPLGQQAAEDRNVLVIGRRRRVMVADEERIEARLARGVGALDHPAGAVARILHGVIARQQVPPLIPGPPSGAGFTPPAAAGRGGELSRSSSRARPASPDGAG